MATKKTSGLFLYSKWDIIPVLCAVAQAAYLVLFFKAFGHAHWWVLGVMGLVYAVGISWNINGVAHNFIHNPYFRSPALNRLFSILQSEVNGFSQVFYEYIHRRHHIGNSDKQDEKGDTIDFLSIYRHGHDGHPENVWKYTFMGYFRDEAKETYADIYRQKPAEARWGVFEIALMMSTMALGFYLNWRFMLFFLPFYYLGHSLSMLNGYYKHFGGNPDMPIAWGVSSYNWLYNIIWFNNGYHAEHHFRPRVHWTEMKQLHEKIKDEQRKAGVRVIKMPHALGFLEQGLDEHPLPGETARPEHAEAVALGK